MLYDKDINPAGFGSTCVVAHVDRQGTRCRRGLVTVPAYEVHCKPVTILFRGCLGWSG